MKKIKYLNGEIAMQELNKEQSNKPFLQKTKDDLIEIIVREESRI